jgi:pyruvate dehydrogenase E2 component (dihydrolipoamide acetyltransferase)
MATDVIMPALGMAQETGQVVRWLRREGEQVTQGQPLIEIETDKVTLEIDAPASGLLASVRADAGDDVPVGTVIALILAPDEEPPGASQATDGDGLAPARSEELREVEPAMPTRPDGTRAPRPAASPLARRLAAELGLDVATLARDLDRPLQASDVRAAAGHRDGSTDATTRPAAGTDRAWRTMAQRTTASWTSAPHFYLERQVDAGRLVSWREARRARTGSAPTYTDLLVRVCAAALSVHPQLRGSWSDGSVVPSDEIGIGIAVALEAGLVVPVIHRADELSLAEIGARRVELVAAARSGHLTPEDVQGGTFTLSNLGMYGVDSFAAILNPSQAALLAVGRIAERVVPVAGVPVVRPTITLTLSCDHRVVDGARGAAFLTAVAAMIEEPATLVD